MNRLKFLFVLFFLALASCDSGDTQTFNDYPLAVGNQWECTRNYTTENFRPIKDSVFAFMPYSAINTVEIMQKMRLKNGQEVFELKTIEGTARGHSYQNQTAGGLFRYAYYNSTPSAPRGGSTRYSLKGMTFASVEELLSVLEYGIQESANRGGDSLFYEIPPVKTLHFPYQKNFKWAFRESEPSLIEKEHLDVEPITTPIGNQNCVKTRWYWDLNRDGISDSNMEGYDYWNQNGLIKREFFIKDILATDEKNDSIGLFDIRDTYQINSFSIR